MRTRRFAAAILLAIAGVSSTARALAHHDSRLLGIWRSDAYGWVMQITPSSARMFHVRFGGCTANMDRDVALVPSTLTDLRWESDASAFTAGTSENITRFRFRRLSHLPDACRRETAGAADAVEVFEAFWQELETHYAFFAERGVSWQRMYREWRPRVSASTSPAELFGILSDMIEPLHDRHVALDAGRVGYTVSGLDPFGLEVMARWRTSPGTGDLWTTYLRAQRPYQEVVDDYYLRNVSSAANGLVTWGRLNDQLGYLRVDRFRKVADDAGYEHQYRAFSAALDQAFVQLASARALVLDLRFNPGGLDGLALHLAGRFFADPAPAFVKFAAAGGTRTPPQEFVVESAGAAAYQGPIAVLTSQMTQSASENVLLALLARRGVVRVGERTAGVHSDELVKPLPNGWIVTISNETFTSLDGRLFETRGFEPDIEVPYLSSDVLASRRDRVLEAAIEALTNLSALQLRGSLLSAIEGFRLQTSAPAVAVGVVADGKVVLRTATGVQHVGQPAPATVKTLFHMASVSKPVVATAIMQLAQSGTLRIEDAAWTHMPAFRLADERWREVTIGQLLSHTSGLPDVENYDWQHPQVDANALDRYLREWRARPLISRPGAAFSYSNLGYEVLAGVIQEATGETFEHYMASNVLQPLGMHASTFYLPDTDPMLLAWPHHTAANGRVEPLEVFPYSRPHAASSTLYSDVDDMLRFMQLHLQGSGAAALHLSSQTLARQHTSRAFTFQHTVPVDRHPAFGWFEMEWHGRHLIVHEGQDDGFTSMLMLEPGAKNGVVLMTNKRDEASSGELWTLTLQMLGHLPRPRTWLPGPDAN